YVSYIMAPEIILDFIKNERLWRKPEIVELLKERERVLTVTQNETKDLDFLPKNRLIFMLQKNIVRNKALKKYEKWFEFAEKTRDENNKKEDFREYTGDDIFVEMMNRLRKDRLTEEDVDYIELEKELWIEVNRLEDGIYKEGKKDGEKIGLEKGEKIGLGKAALNMIKKGMSIEEVAEFTGLSPDELKAFIQKED
ncbi:MAG: hypothetical protein GY940_37310, partial [bacterium]|nr:hypothetical protein [bacterium]